MEFKRKREAIFFFIKKNSKLLTTTTKSSLNEDTFTEATKFDHTKGMQTN